MHPRAFEKVIKDLGYHYEPITDVTEGLKGPDGNVMQGTIEQVLSFLSGDHKSEIFSKVIKTSALADRFVQDALSKICNHLKETRRTSEEIFSIWNRDGSEKIQRNEFITGIVGMKG